MANSSKYLEKPVAPPASRPSRIVSIQVCRGLAAMLVVLSHLNELELKYFDTHMMARFHFGVIGVDLFFVISGIVIASVTAGRFASIQNSGRFLYHRFARIYPVYWCYSAIVLAAYLYNPLWVNANSGHQVNFFRSFLLIPSDRAMLIMQGWTLSYEIYFYIVFALLLLLPEKLAPVALSLWAVLIIGLSIFFPVDSNWHVLSLLASPLILEFLGGCAIYYLYRYVELPRGSGFALIAGSIAWLTFIGIRTSSGQAPLWLSEESQFFRPVFYGPFAALFLLGAMELERTKAIRYPAFLAAIGDWSYSIYLAHIIVAEAFGRAVFRFAPGVPGAIVLIAVLTIAGTLVIGYLSYTFLERRFFVSRTRAVRSTARGPSGFGKLYSAGEIASGL